MLNEMSERYARAKCHKYDVIYHVVCIISPPRLGNEFIHDQELEEY